MKLRDLYVKIKSVKGFTVDRALGNAYRIKGEGFTAYLSQRYNVVESPFKEEVIDMYIFSISENTTSKSDYEILEEIIQNQ